MVSVDRENYVCPIKMGEMSSPHFRHQKVKLEFKLYRHWKTNILGFPMLLLY